MFSSLTRNAVDTLLWICKNQEQGPVTTESISKRLDLSISYLESMLAAVVANVLTLAAVFFAMNVYDRVVPNKAIETFWVLAIGVMSGFCRSPALKCRTCFVM